MARKTSTALTIVKATPLHPVMPTKAQADEQMANEQIAHVRKAALSNLRTSHMQMQAALSELRQTYPKGMPNDEMRRTYNQMVKTRAALTILIDEAEEI